MILLSLLPLEERKTLLKYILIIILSCSFLFLTGCYFGKSVTIDEPPTAIGLSIAEQLNSGQFKAVEAYVDGLVREKPYSLSGMRVLEEVYYLLSNRRDIRWQLKKWCAESPFHHAPFLLRGKYYTAEAWRARGGGWAYTISDKGMGSFKNLLRLAKIDLEKAYKLNPQDPNSSSEMIKVCMGLSLDEKTMETWFKRAVKADPVSVFAYFNKLNYLAPKWHGTPEKQFKFAMDCYTNPPLDSIVYLVMLEYIIESYKKVKNKREFLESESISKLVQDIEDRTLEDFPKSTWARFFLARFKYGLKDYPKVFSYLSEILEIDPENTMALLFQSNCNMEVRRYELAEEGFKRVIGMDPYNASAFYNLGYIAYQVHDDDKGSISFFDKAIELEPTAATSYLQRGIVRSKWIYNKLDALDDFDKVIAIDPREVEAYYQRGECLWDLDETEEAKRCFQQALELIEEEKPKGDSSSFSKGRARSIVNKINRRLGKPPVSLNPEAFVMTKRSGLRKPKAIKINPEASRGESSGGAGINLSRVSERYSERAKRQSNLDRVATSKTVKIASKISRRKSTEAEEIKSKAIKVIPKAPELKLSGIDVSTGGPSFKEKTYFECTDITVEEARRIIKDKGILVLDNLASISPEVAEQLSRHKGFLSLGGITDISVEVAEKLSKHEGVLSLNGLIDISVAKAIPLAIHQGYVNLHGLKTISQETIKIAFSSQYLWVPMASTIERIESNRHSSKFNSNQGTATLTD